MEWLKPSKKSIITFVIVGTLYSFFVFILVSFCALVGGLICLDKPHHSVPNIFPGSSSCQICATNSELIVGYLIMILLYFVLPFIVIYVLSSLLNLKRNSK